VRIEVIEWDDNNLEHATRHGVTMGEIEQAIVNATTVRRNKRGRSGDVRIDSVTDGGRRIVVIAVHDPARRSLRPSLHGRRDG
jgi:uncharacterized DUF497 family protein